MALQVTVTAPDGSTRLLNQSSVRKIEIYPGDTVSIVGPEVAGLSLSIENNDVKVHLANGQIIVLENYVAASQNDLRTQLSYYDVETESHPRTVIGSIAELLAVVSPATGGNDPSFESQLSNNAGSNFGAFDSFLLQDASLNRLSSRNNGTSNGNQLFNYNAPGADENTDDQPVSQITDIAGRNGSPAAPVFTVTGVDIDTGISARDGITREADNILLGSGGTPGATVTITTLSGGTPITVGTGLVAADGSWSIEIPGTALNLADGTYRLTATETTATGATIGSAQYSLTLDRQPPNASIDSATDNVGSIASGSLVTGAFSDDTRPTLTGTTEPDAAVTIFDNGISIGTATADTSGHWLFTPTADLTGSALGTLHSFTTQAIDAAGNTGASSSAFTLTIDTSAAPINFTVRDDAGTITGVLNSGSSSNDATPTLSGTAEIGATVNIYEGTRFAGTAIADGSGAWTITAAGLTGDGAHTLSVSQTDIAGNTSAATNFVYTLDTSAAAPDIVSVSDDAGSITGTIAANGASDDRTLTLAGQAEAGASVFLYEGTNILSAALADSSGNWTITAPQLSSNTTHTLSLIQVDIAGNTSSSRDFVYTLDTVAAAPQITSVSDNIGTFTGNISPGSQSNDSTPTFSGTAESGATIRIYEGTAVIGTGTADGNGAWTITTNTVGSDGLHSIDVRQIDLVGNTSAVANFFYTLDTVAAAAPAITNSTDDAGSITGALNPGALSDDATPTLSGTAEVGATVTIYEGVNLVGTAIADGSGAWTITTSTLAGDGTHSLSVVQTDDAGNTSNPAPFTFTLDTTPPSAPTITNVADDAGAITGVIANNGASDDTTPTLTGRAEAGAVVIVRDIGSNAILGMTTADSSSGLWTITASTLAGEGAHQLSVTQTDQAGNTSPAQVFTYSLDTVADQPSLSVVSDDVGIFTGAIPNNGASNDPTPTLQGRSADAGAVVTVREGSVSIGSTTVDSSGNWTLTTDAFTTDGTHTLSISQVDTVGNTSAATNFVYTLDTSAAAPDIVSVSDDAGSVTGIINSNAISDDTSPVFTGTAELGATVRIFEGGVFRGQATANATTGAWTITAVGLTGDGAHTLSVEQTDGVGNVSAPTSFTYTLDTTALAPSFSVTDSQGSITGTVAANSASDDTTPTLSGTAEASAVVTISENGVALGTVTADATTGAWSFTPNPALTGDGAHTLSVSQVDAVGNTSAATDFVYILDTTAAGPVVTSIISNDPVLSGTVANGGFTTDATPTLTGTAELGATITIYDTVNGVTTSIGRVVASDVTGEWSFTPAIALSGDTAHSFMISQTDTAGNDSASSVYTVTEGHAFRLTGEINGDQVGYSLSSAGDINGDGIDDLIVGATGVNDNHGAAYVIFGAAGGLSGSHSVSEIGTTLAGFRLIGGSDSSGNGEAAGNSVSAAGDLNGDGIGDLIVGAFRADAFDGSAYVIYGGQTALSGDVLLSDVGTGVAGFRLSGAGAEVAGVSVSSAGDINGDGIDDLIVGADGAPNNTFDGAVYVIYGGQTGLSGALELSDVGTPTLAGFRLIGANGEQAGFSVSSAGDINGDGIDDLLIGAPDLYGLANNRDGTSYVIFGQLGGLSGTIQLADVGTGSGPAGFHIPGSGSERTGVAVSRAGDINGDGIDDLIVGAPFAVNTSGQDGTAYVVFGAANLGASGNFDLASLNGSNGFRLAGADDEFAAVSVSNAGDVNGDGIDDLIVGAQFNSTLGVNTGASYVIFGQSSGFSASIHLSDIGTAQGPAGFRITGEIDGDNFGNAVSSAGDINGDGYDDLLVAAPQFSSGGTGQAYVVFGGDFSGAAAQGEARIGTANGETLTDNNGAIDVLLAGAGNDIIAVSDAAFQRIDGGNGTDTLRVDVGNLDLTGIANNRITSIERIDLASDTRTNVLTLDERDLFDLSEGQAVPGIRNSIVIDAGSNDAINLRHIAGGGTWLANGTDGSGHTRYDYTVSGQTEGSVYVTTGANINGVFVPPPTLTSGWILQGPANSIAGFSVSSAGDVNGDGIDDLIVGAPETGSRDDGAAFVVFGVAGGMPRTINLSALDGTNGFRLSGTASVLAPTGGERAGAAVSAAGDVNGDGIGDLIVGARRNDAVDANDDDRGAAYVVYGQASGFLSNYYLPDVGTGTAGALAGFRLTGEAANNNAGTAVTNIGDVNADGIDDLLIGANGYNGAQGAAYVVYGTAGGLSGTFNLAQVGTPALGGLRLIGPFNAFAGRSVSNAGDVNGDGIADLVIGASVLNNNNGAAYVIFGNSASPSGTIDLSTLDGTNGFRLDGSNRFSAGFSVSSAGDVNGDGFDDLIVGAPDIFGGISFAGRAFVVFGHAGSFSSAINLSTAISNGGGFQVLGSGIENAGFSVSSAGDVNGDGFDDLIVGASGSYGSVPRGSNGSAYVIFGHAGGFGTNDRINLSDVGGSVAGFRLSGTNIQEAGYSVSAAGDVNGDGIDDLFVGAPGDHSPIFGVANGAGYVIFGGDFSNALTQNLATAGTLTGDSRADVMNGSSGNDTLIGNGGGDVLRAGAGDDVLALSDQSFQRIDGGNGIDTLRVDAGNLDLTSIANNRITSIEHIDLASDGRANILTLNERDLFDLSEGQAVPGVRNSIIIDAGQNDRVNLQSVGSGSWVLNTTAPPSQQISEHDRYDWVVGGQVEGTIYVTHIEPTAPIPVLGGTGSIRFTGEPRSLVVGGGTIGHQTGLAVSNAGDVNGDGFDDFIIGAPRNHYATQFYDGRVYVVFGGQDLSALAVNGSIDVRRIASGQANQVLGLHLDGEFATSGQAGNSVSAAGDINGDGIADLIVGAPQVTFGGRVGAAYVIFGNTSLGGAHPLEQVGTSQLPGLALGGVGAQGTDVSTIGDINGDGVDDFAVRGAGINLVLPDGAAAYIVYGGTAGVDAGGSVSLSQVGSATLPGFRFRETVSGNNFDLQATIANAGDVNGDGFDDFLIGNRNANTYSGSVYLVFGGQDFAALTTDPSGSILFNQIGASVAGLRLTGPGVYRSAGFSVSAAGDVNGDGFEDFVIGAPYGTPYAGFSYVIFGGTAALSSGGSLSLGAVGTSALPGFQLRGAENYSQLGFSVSNAGDVNGDGFDDLIVGARENNAPPGSNFGAAYVIFGGQNLTGTLSLHDLVGNGGADSIQGFRLIGQNAGDLAGRAVSAAGDVNGDGYDDLLVGAPTSASVQGPGSAYIVFGGNFSSVVTHDVTGNIHTLTGSTRIDILNGSSGNDTLIGNGGADVLRAGAGDDVLAISDQSFQRIDGGNGIDTLRLDAGNLDLTHIANNRITSIEHIDLAADTGANILTLDVHDLFDLSERGAIPGTQNSILITGTAADSINLADFPGITGVWVHPAGSAGTYTDAATNTVYNRVEFHQTNASGALLGTLLVETGVHVNDPGHIQIASLIGGGQGAGVSTFAAPVSNSTGNPLQFDDLLDDGNSLFPSDGDVSLRSDITSGNEKAVSTSGFENGTPVMVMVAPTLLLDDHQTPPHS